MQIHLQGQGQGPTLCYAEQAMKWVGHGWTQAQNTARPSAIASFYTCDFPIS